MYEVALYFAGPARAWSGKYSERERVGTLQARWLWLARLRMLQAFAVMNAGRCAAEIRKDGQFVERYCPPQVDVA